MTSYEHWTDAPLGAHVSLGCGCTGFVVAKYGDSFDLLYTANHARRTPSMEGAYMNHCGPYVNNFDEGLARPPMRDAPVPAWWAEARLRLPYVPEVIK